MKQQRWRISILLAVIGTGVVLIFWGRAFKERIEGMKKDARTQQEMRAVQKGITETVQTLQERIRAAQSRVAAMQKPPVSQDTLATITEKLNAAAAKDAWVTFAHPEAGYTVTYPAHWIRDAARTNDQSFFVRDAKGAFLWITTPPLGASAAEVKKEGKSIRITGAASARELLRDGTYLLQFFHGKEEGLLRIEYPVSEIAFYKPLINYIRETFVLQP